MEFKKLPRYVPAEEVVKREAFLSAQSEIICEKLNDNCLKHYENVALGFSLIDQIDKTNQL